MSPETELDKKERRELRRQERDLEQTGVRRRRSLKRLSLWLGALIILAGAVYGLIYLASRAPVPTEGTLTVPVSDGDWKRGSASAPLVLVEYSDFQCPACGAYYPILKKLKEDFGDRLLFVYRHFPLSRIHPNAEPAARAAEAAGRQGKFWEMHDKIFEQQNSWSGQRNPEGIFEGYVRDLGLDGEKFKTDYGSSDLKKKVQTQYEGGFQAGVNATPTFFLNGKKIVNPQGYRPFKELLERTSNE